MATSGRRLDPQTVARIRRLCRVCRLSIRQAAREERVSTRTVQKCLKGDETSASRAEARRGM